MVHFNYLKPCFTPPEIQKRPSRAATSTRVEERPPVETSKDVREPTQGTSADSGDVELEWLENPAANCPELTHPAQEREE